MIKYAFAVTIATAITLAVMVSINYGSIAAVALHWGN